MRLSHRIPSALAVAALGLALAACWSRATQTSGPRWLENGRTARGLPPMFFSDTTNKASRTRPGEACTVRMKDPRDGTRLLLVRSQRVGGDMVPHNAREPQNDSIPRVPPIHQGIRGDYAVDPARYGVGPSELLRLDCVSGRALGIVSSGAQ